MIILKKKKKKKKIFLYYSKTFILDSFIFILYF